MRRAEQLPPLIGRSTGRQSLWTSLFSMTSIVKNFPSHMISWGCSDNRMSSLGLPAQLGRLTWAPWASVDPASRFKGARSQLHLLPYRTVPFRLHTTSSCVQCICESSANSLAACFLVPHLGPHLFLPSGLPDLKCWRSRLRCLTDLASAPPLPP